MVLEREDEGSLKVGFSREDEGSLKWFEKGRMKEA